MQLDGPIPTPDQSGSTGTQLANKADLLTEARPYGLHIAATIEGIASTNSKAFGGEIAAAFIASAARQMTQEHREIKLENRRLTDKLDTMRDELEATRTSNAVLLSQVASHGRTQHLRNFAIFLGTSLLNVAVALPKDQFIYAVGSAAGGSLLLLLGWLSSVRWSKA
ncbi:hypothetical protein [Polaromonas sp. AER18D-145]|uniref:hypothetical protein n=1 Tax=Polaromonas sp. AER18D-145 TaxID=1977060 RepID=UPI0011425996|nr:hypothetical protein [Polaromonas sp. AER18D-145]